MLKYVKKANKNKIVKLPSKAWEISTGKYFALEIKREKTGKKLY